MGIAKGLKISYDISNKCDNLIFTKTKFCNLCDKNSDIIPQFVPTCIHYFNTCITIFIYINMYVGYTLKTRDIYFRKIAHPFFFTRNIFVGGFRLGATYALRVRLSGLNPPLS